MSSPASNFRSKVLAFINRFSLSRDRLTEISRKFSPRRPMALADLTKVHPSRLVFGKRWNLHQRKVIPQRLRLYKIDTVLSFILVIFIGIVFKNLGIMPLTNPVI